MAPDDQGSWILTDVDDEAASVRAVGDWYVVEPHQFFAWTPLERAGFFDIAADAFDTEMRRSKGDRDLGEPTVYSLSSGIFDTQLMHAHTRIIMPDRLAFLRDVRPRQTSLIIWPNGLMPVQHPFDGPKELAESLSGFMIEVRHEIQRSERLLGQMLHYALSTGVLEVRAKRNPLDIESSAIARGVFLAGVRAERNRRALCIDPNGAKAILFDVEMRVAPALIPPDVYVDSPRSSADRATETHEQTAESVLQFNGAPSLHDLVRQAAAECCEPGMRAKDRDNAIAQWFVKRSQTPPKASTIKTALQRTPWLKRRASR